MQQFPEANSSLVKKEGNMKHGFPCIEVLEANYSEKCICYLSLQVCWLDLLFHSIIVVRRPPKKWQTRELYIFYMHYGNGQKWDMYCVGTKVSSGEWQWCIVVITMNWMLTAQVSVTNQGWQGMVANKLHNQRIYSYVCIESPNWVWNMWAPKTKAIHQKEMDAAQSWL